MPKKAKNAYSCFADEFMKKEHDPEELKDAGGLFKMAGAAWAKMSEKEKAPYEKLKEKDATRYANQLAEREKKGYFKLEDGTKSTDPDNAKLFKVKKSKKAADSDSEEEHDPKPKRAAGAYNFFMTEKTAELQKSKPEMSFGERAGEISNMWKEMSDKDKAKYDKMAEPEKKRYEQQMAELKSKGYFIMEDGSKSTDAKNRVKAKKKQANQTVAEEKTPKARKSVKEAKAKAAK